MGKSTVDEKNSNNTRAKTSKIKKAQQKLISFERSKEKYAQFFEFLKALHGSQRTDRSLEIINEPLIKEVSQSVMHFFNHQKNYKLQELERYFIYLANLLNILRDESGALNFEGEFKSKIRRFLTCMVQARMEGRSKNSKIQALLYILSILIYRERVNVDRSIRDLNQSIYSDKNLVKQLLSLSFGKYKKMGKFYGIIMIHLSNQQNCKSIKEAMIKSIFMNIAKIDHQVTFFNFLVYLRNEKNKVKINYQNVVDGQIFEILINAYPKYMDRYQSYYILDYLNHLLTLFPALVSKIPQENFISKLLLSASPVNIHHPLQESTIISFVESTLRYAESNTKNIILNEIINFLLANKYLALKLAHLVIDYDIEEVKIMQMIEAGYFNSFLSFIKLESEENLVKRSIELFKRASKKIREINRSISDYMMYQLDCQVRLLQQKKSRMMNRNMNHQID